MTHFVFVEGVVQCLNGFGEIGIAFVVAGVLLIFVYTFASFSAEFVIVFDEVVAVG